MPLSDTQRQHLENWMRSKAIVQCPACGDVDRWRYAEAYYLRALIEQGEPDLAEDKGVVKVSCGNCGVVQLFDAEFIGIRGLWAEGGGL